MANNESSSFDSAVIQADFEELYRLMNMKSQKEVAEIIYAVCAFCRNHKEGGFIEGLKIGLRLAEELSNREDGVASGQCGVPQVNTYEKHAA